MGERIRQLEDALAILQAKCTTEPHPLLRDDVASNQTPERDDDGPSPDTKDQKSAQDVLEAFGTLSVYDHGVSRFFGPSGGTEVRIFFTLRSKWSTDNVSCALSICSM